MELKARKAYLVASVVDGGYALSGTLTEADIRNLLDLTAYVPHVGGGLRLEFREA